MKILEIDDTLKLPEIKIGDTIKTGRFKNKKATVKGFTKDKNNHPVLKTNKGDQKLFRVRLDKLEDQD